MNDKQKTLEKVNKYSRKDLNTYTVIKKDKCINVETSLIMGVLHGLKILTWHNSWTVTALIINHFSFSLGLNYSLRSFQIET